MYLYTTRTLWQSSKERLLYIHVKPILDLKSIFFPFNTGCYPQTGRNYKQKIYNVTFAKMAGMFNGN